MNERLADFIARLTWPLLVAIGGGVFAVFSLIYNDYYIYYGLFTVAFGIATHALVMFFDWYFHIDENHKYVDQRNYWIAHVCYGFFLVYWAASLCWFY